MGGGRRGELHEDPMLGVGLVRVVQQEDVVVRAHLPPLLQLGERVRLVEVLLGRHLPTEQRRPMEWNGRGREAQERGGRETGMEECVLEKRERGKEQDWP